MAEGKGGAADERLTKLERSKITIPRIRIPGAVKNLALVTGLFFGGQKAADVAKDHHEVITEPAVHAMHKGLVATADIVSDIGPEGTDASKAGGVKIEALEQKKEVDEVIDLFYSGLDDRERRELEVQLRVTQAYMADILPPEAFQNIKDKEQLINKVCSENNLDPRVLIALIFAESRGGVDGGLENMTEDGALGWVQITPPFAQTVGLNGITSDPSDSRLNLEIALPIAAKTIREDSDYFGDVSLGMWAWHMGRAGVEDIIDKWAQEKGVLREGSVRDFVIKHKLNTFQLFQVKDIREELEKEGWDKTTIFVLRGVGAVLLREDLTRMSMTVYKNTSE